MTNVATSQHLSAWLALLMLTVSLFSTSDLALADDQPDAKSALSGVWAPTYNKCVEPTAIQVRGASVVLEPYSGDTLEDQIIRVDGNTVYTESKSKDGHSSGEEAAYIVSKDTIVRLSTKLRIRMVKCDVSPPSESASFTCDIARGGQAKIDFIKETNKQIEKAGLSEYVKITNVESGQAYCLFRAVIQRRGTPGVLLDRLCSDKVAASKRPVNDDQLYLNYIILNEREPYDSDFEECYEEIYGQGVWDTLLPVIAGKARVPLSRTVIRAEGPGGGHYFNVWFRDGAVRYRILGLYAGVSSLQTISTTIGSAATLGVPDDSSMPQVEAAFAKFVSSSYGASATVESRDQGHTSFVLRNLRGVVIAGQHNWELVHVDVFLSRQYIPTYNGGEYVERGMHALGEKDFRLEEKLQLRVVVDGLYSAGAGLYPKDEFFTENMEPKFHAQLSEFAITCADKLAGMLGRS